MNHSYFGTEAALEDLSVEALEELILRADDAYYNVGVTPDKVVLMCDAEYDALKDQLRLLAPRSPVLLKVGAPLTDGKQKVDLPFKLRSLDKIKAGNAVQMAWLQPRRYVVTPKLDGCSLLVKLGPNPVAYTRGDGDVGGDVTHLLPFLHLPALPHDVWVRGELLMRRSAFAARWAESYANTRNCVAGLTNAQDVRAPMQDLVFLAYEVVSSDHPDIPTSDAAGQVAALESLEQHGLAIPPVLVVSDASESSLCELLAHWREQLDFDMDGLVVQFTGPYEREEDGNPSYARAFKHNSDEVRAQTRVVGVEWNYSKDGFRKPRIELEPVQLAGATITYATGFNARFILDNGIGPGAVVTLIRSGDVIPHIEEVVLMVEPAMPVHYETDDVWSSSGIDLVARNPDALPEVILRRMVHFSTTLELDAWGEGTLSKLVDAGYRGLEALLTIPEEALARLPGLAAASARKLVEARAKGLQNVSQAALMDACGAFGRSLGTSRSQWVLDAYPDLEAEFKGLEHAEVVAKLVVLNGFADITASQFADGLPGWFAFWDMARSHITLKVRPVGGTLSGQVVCVSGFRDAQLSEAIEAAGGTLSDSFSSKVTLLVVKDPNGGSTKIDKAKERGTPVLSREEFRATWLSN